MDNRYRVYKEWAPEDVVWSPWVKPVLFSQAVFLTGKQFDLPDPSWACDGDRSTLLIVDLPGELGVLEGLALAQMGYRPIPLYNGVYTPCHYAMVVDVTKVVEGLYEGAGLLSSFALRSDALPAFLLDSNRMKSESNLAGKYDNRWCIFPQDMPSADFLLEQGIKQIYVRTKFVQNDLSHILKRYQQKGIRIFHSNDDGLLNELKIVRPSLFRSCYYRFQTIFGLTRNAAGGFGGMVPEATQSSGLRHYGVG